MRTGARDVYALRVNDENASNNENRCIYFIIVIEG